LAITNPKARKGKCIEKIEFNQEIEPVDVIEYLGVPKMELMQSVVLEANNFEAHTEFFNIYVKAIDERPTTRFPAR